MNHTIQRDPRARDVVAFVSPLHVFFHDLSRFQCIFPFVRRQFGAQPVRRHPTTGGLSRSVGTSRRASELRLSRMVCRGCNANWRAGTSSTQHSVTSQEIPNLCPPTFTRCSPPDSVTCANSSNQFDTALAAGTPTTATQRIPRRNPILDARVLIREIWSNSMERWVGCPKIEHWEGGRIAADRCYQTCYHFLQKASRNKMKQGPTR